MIKMSEMLALQQSLNDMTNGENWESGITKNGKKIDWQRCIYMECAEMIDSFSWKHWKSISAPADWENLKIEVVDVWHFVMSLALQEYKKKDLGSLDDCVSYIVSLPHYSLLIQEEELGEEEEIMALVENVMRDSLDKKLNVSKLMEDFFILVSQSGLNLDSLYKLYIGKNILNSFRQDNGYKEGTYIKVWNGEEDNVVMSRILNSSNEITVKELYKKLKDEYKKVS